MGSEMFRAAIDHPEFRVTYCADIDSNNIMRLKSEFPSIKFTQSPFELIESNEVDAVYIAVPPDFHAVYSVRSMIHNKAVFCEKPLTVNLSDGMTMIMAATETKMVNVVNFPFADRHAVYEIERAIKEGEVGNIMGVEIRLLFPEWPRKFQAKAAWLSTRTQGGFIREVFSHFVYLTDRILSPLTPVFVRLDHTPEDFLTSEVNASGLFYSGNVPVKLNALSGAAIPETYEWNLYGSKRSYSIRNWDELYQSDGTGWQSVTLHQQRGTEKTRLTLFAKAIRGEQHNLPDFAVGFRVARIIESFHQSIT